MTNGQKGNASGRRSNGTGSIRKRGQTFTTYWWTVDNRGKRIQRSKGGFRTKKSAQTHLNSILSKVQSGEWKPDQPLTVGQLLVDHWLPSQMSRNRRPSTLSQNRFVVNKWLVPYLGDHRASALTPGHVQAFIETLSKSKSLSGRRGLSPRSVQLAVGTLKSAYKFAVESELIGRNPIANVRRPALQPRAMNSWSESQARKFLTQTRGDTFAAAWALLLTRGLRRGELCGLRWEAIDLEAGTATILHTLVVVDGRVQTSTPKTSSGRRSIPLDASLILLLTAHRKRQSEDRLRAGNAWTDTGYVFADQLGRAIGVATV